MSDDEISPTQLALLAARVSQPDLHGLPEWMAANLLNVPDVSLPKVKQKVATGVAQQLLLTTGEWAKAVVAAGNEALPEETRAAAILMRDTIRQSSHIEADDPEAYEAVGLVLTKMVQVGLLSAATKDRLLALADRHPSWAEANGVTVTARTVGLARGGV
ncbi:MAG: hypothetical protein LW713_01695 [Acetobacteraceae bacterium]|jgi:hypothetical protein|nr:hypothetical protein [Acetobacteraceae bacterium]